MAEIGTPEQMENFVKCSDNPHHEGAIDIGYGLTKECADQAITILNKASKPVAMLFLDDYRLPVDCATYMYLRQVDCKIYHKEWVIVRSRGQFVEWIERNGLPEFISFDYDLCDATQLKEELPVEEWFDAENNREYNGLDCATWLVEHCHKNNKPLPGYAIHSANPAGVESLKNLFSTFAKSH